MLTRSDNLFAELLLKEVGLRVQGQGTSAAGIAAGVEVLGRAHVPTEGASADGSGLSRANHRSARQWREMLQAALSQPWAAAFRDALPVAGRSGTLSRRLLHGPAAGNVRAKTGWIDEARALSGYLTTSSGRPAIFSILVNGTTPSSPVSSAIDDLVAAIAADGS
jgi:D-alanyl-D-alanine carboxypeptidase/D-alanyl-D-alanine-endopeptidase (penicillin-binding protein 4)